MMYVNHSWMSIYLCTYMVKIKCRNKQSDFQFGLFRLYKHFTTHV